MSTYRGDNIIVVSALEEDLEETINQHKAGVVEAAANGTLANGNSVTNKSVSVYKWPVRFNGRSDKNSLNSFLQRVDELRVARKCTKEELFEAASDLFEDYALEWYRAQLRHQRFDTWDSLVKELKKDFLPSDYDSELWKQIEKRTQHFNEPVVIYISIMENLFECLTDKPSDEKKLRILTSQVLPEYQSHVALQNITEVSRLVQVCRALEESEKVKKSFRPPPSKNVATLEPGLACAVSSGASSSDRSGTSSRGYAIRHDSNQGQRRERKTHYRGVQQVAEVQCWKCNGFGHVKRDCKKQQRIPTCYGCGKEGVIRPNCPTCCPKNE